MGIFDRLRRLIKANVNNALDKAEDPEKMLNQLLVEMSEQLSESKRAVASAIADEKRLERQILEYKGQSSDWERKALLALTESERNPDKRLEYEDLAKQALVRKKEIDDIAVKLSEQLVAQHNAVEKLKLSLKDLQHKIEDAQRKRTLLVARAKRAEASKKIQEQVAGLSTNTSAFEAFDRMAQKVDQIEAEADAMLEIESATSGASLEQEFAKLEKQRGGDTLLEDFRREQKAKSVQIPAGNPEQKRTIAIEGRAANPEVDLMMEELKKKLHGA